MLLSLNEENHIDNEIIQDNDHCSLFFIFFQKNMLSLITFFTQRINNIVYNLR